MDAKDKFLKLLEELKCFDGENLTNWEKGYNQSLKDMAYLVMYKWDKY